MDYEPRSEQSITDDEKTRFLIELMMTGDWGDDFEFVVQLKEKVDYYHIQILFGEYMHRLGLVKHSKRNDFIYDISVKGRKYLEQQKGEKHEQ